MKSEFEKITPENIFDSGDLKILICYLLDTLNEPVPATETAQLFHYEGITNYFDAQTAIYELSKDGYLEELPDQKDVYVITEKGRDLNRTLKDTVSLSLRDKTYKAVLKMLLRYKREKDTNILIERTDHGSLLTCKVTNKDDVLFSFQILLPNEAQANALREQILNDPKYYYDSFINTLTEDISAKTNS